MEATYKCPNCGKETTVVTKPGPDDADIVQPPVDGCPECGRLLSPRFRIS